MKDVPEKDWKTIRTLKEKALDLACRRILEKSSKIIEVGDKNAHGKYLDLYKMIDSEDKQIAHLFSDLKRSTAIMKLSLWKFNNLIGEEDLKSFSDESRGKVESLIEIYNKEP